MSIKELKTKKTVKLEDWCVEMLTTKEKAFINSRVEEFIESLLPVGIVPEERYSGYGTVQNNILFNFIEIFHLDWFDAIIEDYNKLQNEREIAYRNVIIENILDGFEDNSTIENLKLYIADVINEVADENNVLLLSNSNGEFIAVSFEYSEPISELIANEDDRLIRGIKVENNMYYLDKDVYDELTELL